MIDKKAQMRMVGASSGRVINLWVCQYDAPSTAAASDNSSGICMPARSKITAKPTYFQVRMSIKVQIASWGLASQSCASQSRPIDLNRSLTAPFVWSMRLQLVPAMTSAITYGTKMSTRMID